MRGKDMNLFRQTSITARNALPALSGQHGRNKVLVRCQERSPIQSAGAVPAATVVATATLQTGLKTTTVSTAAGVYVFASLPVGIV
jgi:hypothetical protein